MKPPKGWVREEPGWYVCEARALSIVRERDGWYLYDWNTGSEAPDRRYETLGAALAAAVRT